MSVPVTVIMSVNNYHWCWLIIINRLWNIYNLWCWYILYNRSRLNYNWLINIYNLWLWRTYNPFNYMKSSYTSKNFAYYSPLSVTGFYIGKFVFKKRIPTWTGDVKFGADHLLITRMWSMCPSLIESKISL